MLNSEREWFEGHYDEWDEGPDDDDNLSSNVYDAEVSRQLDDPPPEER